MEFEGEGVNEIAKDKATGKVVLKVNPDFFRPAEVELLIGNPAKAEKELGWKAENGIKEMCADSWRWQSNNPNGYEE